MPALSTLTRQKLVERAIHLGDGDVVKVTFDRNKITPSWLMRAAQRETEENDLQSTARALAEVIVSWDITDDAGAMMPPSVETMSLLSIPAQAKLLEQVMLGAVPSDAEGNASSATPDAPPSATSAPTQPTSQNGAVTEPSLSVSASQSPT
jgi:hypothetical protein